jgi:Mg/Co/Ni transporter MgtE
VSGRRLEAPFPRGSGNRPPGRTDEDLLGVAIEHVPIEALLAADREAAVEAVMDSDPPAVAPGVDQEVAAWVMCRRNEETLAVVDVKAASSA